MSIFEAAIGVLAPPQCFNCQTDGASLCDVCMSSLLFFGEKCWRCNAVSPGCRICDKCQYVGGPSHAYIGTNHSNLARDLLSLYKFGNQRAAAKPIADFMTRTLLTFKSSEDLIQEDLLIVPVPTASSRIRERGFGHSELLARKIALTLRLNHANALRRLDQIRQLGSKRDDRLKQLSDSFALKHQKQVTGRNILLIDDVVTTGGTLIAATKTLRAAGAKHVDALLFAKRL